MTRVFHFGREGRRLFGIYTSGSVSDNLSGTAVLFCNPFGQEAIRMHRLFRVLSDQLAGMGISSLRFDYFGTGDSAGDDIDCDLVGWEDDVRTAHAELRRRSGAQVVTWFGAGLGATAVLRAARGEFVPHRAVLWNPVVDGSAYLQQLRVRHVESLEAVYSFPDEAWRRALADPAAFQDEASGFAIPPRLREQLSALQLEALTPAATRMHAVVDPKEGGLSHWLEEQRRSGRSISSTTLPEMCDWGAEELQGTALVPRPTVECLLRVLTEET